MAQCRDLEPLKGEVLGQLDMATDGSSRACANA